MYTIRKATLMDCTWALEEPPVVMERVARGLAIRINYEHLVVGYARNKTLCQVFYSILLFKG